MSNDTKQAMVQTAMASSLSPSITIEAKDRFTDVLVHINDILSRIQGETKLFHNSPPEDPACAEPRRFDCLAELLNEGAGTLDQSLSEVDDALSSLFSLLHT